ncbi:MAG: DUF885 family protein [Clostridia bacterium]|nr:DUF885 family protein [Clostridia bacterium]
MKRIIGFILAALMLLTTFAGCKEEQVTEANPTASPAPVATTAATPTAEVETDAEQEFLTLDREVFAWLTTSSYRYYGYIDAGEGEISKPTTLGSYSNANALDNLTACRGFLTRLEGMDKLQLSLELQYAYDVMQRYLSNECDSLQHFEMYEPFFPFFGEHQGLCQFFITYPLTDGEDVEAYLALLADLPRYANQLISHEEERCNSGTFMTEYALNQVLDELYMLLDGSFVSAAFISKLNDLHSLDEDTRESFISRHDELIENSYCTAYNAMYESLLQMQPYCREPLGLSAAFGREGVSYYESLMKNNAASNIAVDEARELVELRIDDTMLLIAILYELDSEIFSISIDTEVATTSEALDYMQGLSLPYPVLEGVDCTPHYGAPNGISMQLFGNRLIVFESQPIDLFDFARTVYPREQYLFKYQNQGEAGSLFLKVAPINGYYGGWAIDAEAHFATNAEGFYEEYCQAQFANSLLDLLLLASSDMLVNYYGYDEENLYGYLQQYFMEELAHSYYETVVAMPGYHIGYAIGYCELTNMAQASGMDEADFYKSYLELGAGYYDLIRDYIFRDNDK